MLAVRHHLRWLAPLLVLAVAAVVRFWALSSPGSLVFDELYYVRDAISQLAHGAPTVWSDDDAAFGDPAAFTDEASYAVHPPLGKWLIGLGVLVFGPDTGWGWRSAVALAGVATVGITMRLGWLLSRSLVIACTAGLLLALDGVHVVLTRVALLDGFLALAVALGALLMWRDVQWLEDRDARAEPGPSGRTAVRWWRPWLLAAGLVFGAAAGIKWSGLYPLAAFLVFLAIRDLLRRRNAGAPWGAASLRSLLQAGATAIIALPAAVLAYLTTWVGWIVTPDGWGRDPATPWLSSLARYHAEMLGWHSTLTAPHPYQAHPITWPLGLRPTAMYEVRWDGCGGECVAGISPIPNLLITWGGAAALLVLAWLVVRALVRPDALSRGPVLTVSAFVLTGYLSGWLPWLLTVSRSAVFQFYAVVLTPFSALALALVLGMLCGIPLATARASAPGLRLDPDPAALQGRRLAVAVFLIAAVAVSILFAPLWTGGPVAEWFWNAHMWLPGWD
ncbi:phospholipid carrier-dependent glycosyltransferase [Leucobacter rhizosphaerae]|uniref:Polyprenol-phosphate-mannose--protein mannosyltransferase n=1 Tax=Leucobacter rhizosphaerae TaxID=2932245 RepID=A0ABY4FZD0_9MICO|nr:phospholipid carrier-dependent glycosyltransferase [Leucobacter rhizosphaerae]UOQ61655.1 phospholipid carrier-dependent glycosyltransferase [Leucobacter rhizosphaerae]